MRAQGWLEGEDRRARMFPRTFKMVSTKGTATRVLFGNLVEEMEAYQRKALGVKPSLRPAISETGTEGHAFRGILPIRTAFPAVRQTSAVSSGFGSYEKRKK